jgi:hypothetical protein
MIRSLLVLLFACIPLSAQGIAVGATAVEFTPRNWINPPTWASFEELRGDVVLIKAWGKNCKVSMSQLPAMNKFTETPGLHVVTLYAQVHKLDEIEALVGEHAIKYPIALDSFWQAGYECPTLPTVWIIGVDGKVKFVGSGEFDEVLSKELAKVKYPGLGKEKVASALEPAARLFAQGNFADAYKAAETIYDETDSEAEEDDADWIMKRIDGRMNSLSVRAETAEVLKDYDVAMRCWHELTRFKGLDDAAEAPQRLKQLTDSADAKKELAARRALLSLILTLDVEFQAVDDTDPEPVRLYREKCLKAYAEFAVANKGTAASDRASELVVTFKKILGLEDPPEPQDGKNG